jgi:hypothetical protein
LFIDIPALPDKKKIYGRLERILMKNKALMSLVLLAFVTASAVFAPRVFAQSPTLDKLSFSNSGGGSRVSAANKTISGAVVIPETYNNRFVSEIYNFSGCQAITSVVIPSSVLTITSSAFSGCVGLTSITIPASVTTISGSAFANCNALTSVTIQGSAKTSNNSFPGDLSAKYQAGGAGTYTRQAGQNNWTKQAAASTSAPTYLDGYWQLSNGLAIIVRGNTADFIRFGSLSPLSSSAVEKGYIKEGSQFWRNIRSTGNLTWSLQELRVRYNTSNPNVATGTEWRDYTLTMSADGQTMTESDGTVWTRLWVQ